MVDTFQIWTNTTQFLVKWIRFQNMDFESTQFYGHIHVDTFDIFEYHERMNKSPKTKTWLQAPTTRHTCNTVLKPRTILQLFDPYICSECKIGCPVDD